MTDFADSAETTAKQQRGRPFEKGRSGNPGGRPPGARHKSKRAIEALLDGQGEALTKKAIDKAMEGDMIALRLCLDRIVPPRREAAVSFKMPKVRSIADTVTASTAVLAALTGGEITPGEAGKVMAILSAHKAIVEAGEIEARVAALEKTRRPL